MKDKLNQVDLAFVVDTTGSMGPFIEQAREQMTATLDALAEDAEIAPDLQVAVVEYRDHPPQEETFVFRAHAFTGSRKRVQSTIRHLRPTGGGDAPEAVYDGLRAACDRLTWRPHSRRLAVLVGDAPPHGVQRHGDTFPDGCPCGLTLESTTALIEQGGIILYALGLTPAVRESFAPLAYYTGGEYFAVGRGANAIDAIRTVLVAEFADLAFDRRVLEQCARDPDWTVDGLCEALDSSCGRVSASINRLGQRHLLQSQV